MQRYNEKSFEDLIEKHLLQSKYIKGNPKDYDKALYDNACGSGGMLTESKAFIKNLQPTAEINLYGQEVNPETYAICKADMLIKGENPENIKFGSTLSDDQFKQTP
ncbi:N-6 DNA methylase [Helicobacter suis]|uniref:N-6 DNA methylase n=1 Tax=Helicobacter suis TaxID=104628 RepID=UPI00220A5158|nr:hypothetical protein HSHS1_09630 [Helicobacter suis HS1]